jgi:hypothetical protein
MTKIKHIVLKIKGVDWKVFIQSPAAYRRMHGNDSSAISYPEDRELYFKKDHIKFGTVCHELLHSYVASSGTTSANITADQMEEHICELLEDHIFDLLNDAKKVMDFIAKG